MFRIYFKIARLWLLLRSSTYIHVGVRLADTLKKFSKCGAAKRQTTCKLDCRSQRNSTSSFPGVVRFFDHYCPVYRVRGISRALANFKIDSKKKIIQVVLLPILVFSSPLAITENMIDPMRPPAVSTQVSPSKGSKAPRWEVSAILVSSGRRLAMVNNRLLGVGATVDGARIKAIYGNAVELDIDGRPLVIRPAVPSVRQVKKIR